MTEKVARKVAIVGYSVRFPGGDGESFWQALLNNKDLVTEVADDRWSMESFLHPDKRHTGTSYTFAAGSLGDVSGFDASFFGLSPREVNHMDPQQRMLLEMSWEAMEHAGMPPSRLRGSNCGVFIGLASLDYSFRYADDLNSLDTNTATGTTASIAANRISYLFDLHGPSLAMDTACSSSLVAFHLACSSILSGETDLALTGGINLHLHPLGFIGFSRSSMLSPTGRCHVFDESGDGYVRSEGGGVLLLKEYEQAITDGDRILAVVAGSGVNTDGDKSGLTIPNPDAQADLMRQCYQRAGISVDEITYLEAHGTGTPVGDPIETLAIGEALGKLRSTPLPIGSVKSNLGHLETASGVAGLVKALEIIRRRTIPATIGIRKLNSRIKSTEWNIDVVRENRTLPPDGRIVIGVNSFGFGGANAHVILTSPPESSVQESVVPTRVVPLRLSARSDEALREMAGAIADRLDDPSVNVYDLAWSTWHHREHLAKGALLNVDDREQAVNQLREFSLMGESEGVFIGERISEAHGPVFVFSGNGCQWDGMGRRLLTESSVFRATIEEINDLFVKLGGFSLLDEINGKNGPSQLAKTEIAQPLLFALQVGICRVLQDNGVTPVAVTGHSVGEVAAAWASGALSLRDAVQVIYHRSAQQAKTAGIGQMTAVALSIDDLDEMLATLELDELAVAGINSPRGLTVAGSVEQLTRMEDALTEQAIRFKRLDLDYAFHSPTMDGIKLGVLDSLAIISPRSSTIPFISTVTGSVFDGEKLDAEYWWENIRQPVLFHSAVNDLVDNGNSIFIEIGGHSVLSGYVNEVLRSHEREGLLIPTLMRDRDGAAALQNAVARILLSGLPISLEWYFPVAGKFIELPAYPWQKEHFWHPISSESMGLLYRNHEHPLLGYRMLQQELSWENELDSRRLPWLTDHMVGGGVVFPGAGFVEMALAAASAWRSDKILDIEELEILAPLLLDDTKSKRVRVALDARNGGLTLFSRDHASDDKWAQHLRARVMRQTSGTMLDRKAPKLPSRKPDFTSDEHVLAASQIGLDYGPAFSAIHQGWIDKDQVIAGINLNNAIAETMPGMLLHPGVLDSAFQLFIQLLKDEMQQHQGVAFVPTQVGRVQINAALSNATPSIMKVKLLRRLPHSLLTEVEIFNKDGSAIAVLAGVRFRAIPLRHQHRQHIDWLDYYLSPLPLPGETSHQYTGIDEFSGDFTLAQQENVHFNIYPLEVEPLLDSLVETAIQTLVVNKGNNLPLSSRAQRLGTALLARGITNAETPEVDAKEIWHLLLREYPGYFSLLHLAGRYALHLEELISEDDKPAQLGLGQQKRADIWKAIWSQSGLYAFSRELAKQIRDMQAELPAGSRLSISELSASHPHFVCAMCEAADFRVTDVTFISDNDVALNDAEHVRERYPLLKTSLLDADTGRVQSSLSGVNLLIVSLDWFSVTQARKVLQQIQLILAPGARVIFLGHHPAWWLDQVFGLLDDWWLDAENTHQISAESWSSLLSEIGYQDIKLDSVSQAGAGAWIMQAKAGKNIRNDRDDGNNKNGHWYLIDNNDRSDSLAAVITAGLNERGLRASLHANIDGCNLKPGDHVILLNITADNESWLEDQVLRSRLAIDVSRHCEMVGECELWVLTHGVSNMYPIDQDIEQLPATKPAPDAIIWGLCRTLANEFSSVKIRTLDLPDINMEVLSVSTVIDILLSNDVEAEQVLTTSGMRFVPRLRYVERDISTEIKHTTALTLGFDLPGQLRNLRWKSHDLPSPGAGELSVEVLATGLNFRDVMYALGMLSDEAIENGFSGPTLGLEFAGRVTAVGSGISEFSPGDDVVGFGPASFSSRLIASVDAVAHIPKDIDHSAAATIPTTFFTVYYALKHLARMEPGERLLIHGAAGGVGIAAVQLAQWMGVEIYATVGSPEKRDFLRLLGVENIYDSRSVRFAEDILADTVDGQGVDVVLNSLAGEAINQNLRVLKPFGRFLELGKRDFYENTPIGLRPFRNNISYFGIDSDQLMKVKPELTNRLFRELMSLFESGELYPLPYTMFAADQVEEAFRYMQQARQIGKVIIGYPHLPKATPVAYSSETTPLTLSSESTWLVTGGLNGFGLRTAEWLVEHGVRHLLLLSRTGVANQESAQKIAALEKSGVQVVCAGCDVSDRVMLANVLTLYEQVLPPISGVVHAATVYADKIASNIEDADLRAVLMPKVVGAWNLHTTLKNLDHFILFSSATTLFGNPGQCNYVAANHWLEALAMHRYREGLPATCVRWGAIDDVGFLARNDKVKDALNSRMGGSPLASDVALNELAHMLQMGVTTRGVLELDWSALSRFLPTAYQPKFQEIAAIYRGEDNSGDDDLRVRLQEMLVTLSAEDFHMAVINMLRSELSKILLIPEDKISADRSVYDMGFDSLMGVELMVAVESRFGVQLPVMALSEASTLTKLANLLCNRLRTSDIDADDETMRGLAAQHGVDIKSDGQE